MSKAGTDFVFPALLVPNSTACIDERLELCGIPAHVSWRSKNDRVRSIERVYNCLILPTTVLDIFADNTKQSDFTPGY